MFNHYTSTQPLADQIKALIGPRNRAARRVYNLLTRFERAAWVPREFEAVVDGEGFRYDGTLTYTGSDAPQATERLLEGYLAAIGDQPDADEMLTLRQVADLVGASLSVVKVAAQSGELTAEYIDAPGNGFYRVRRADAETWGTTFHAPRDHRRGRKPKTAAPR